MEDGEKTLRANLVPHFVEDIELKYSIDKGKELGESAMGCTVRGGVLRKSGERLAIKTFSLQQTIRNRFEKKRWLINLLP